MTHKTYAGRENCHLSTKKDTDMIRTAFWVEKILLNRCDANLEVARCRSRNEFVNESIRFYIAWLNGEKDQDFLCEAIRQTMEGIVKTSENRLARLQFKLAVEQAKLAHLIASLSNVDDEALRKLHIRCMEEVKRINGVVKLEDAIRYEQGE